MASPANLKPTNGIGLEPGELSPEDADRFAAAFRPMWEFDDAPFAATAANLSDSDVRELSAGGVNADVAAALKAPIAQKPPPPAARPVAPAQARALRPNPDSLGQHPQQRAAPAVPQRSRPPQSSVDLDIAPIRKSNTGIFIGLGAVVVAVGLFFGVRAAMSDPAESTAPTTKQTATPSMPKEEAHAIPPPPAAVIADPTPPTPTPTPTALAATTAVPAPAPEPPKAPEKPVVAARPEPPPPPPRPQPARYDHPPPPRPAPAPAPAPKKPGGGIVRDTPF